MRLAAFRDIDLDMGLFRRRAVWVAVAMGVAAAIVFGVRARGRAVTTVATSRKDLEHRIVSTGRVLAPARVQVSSLTPGLVVTVGPSLGQHVDVGDLLVQLDDKEARASLSQAKASVEQARARVSQVAGVGKELANQSLAQAQTQLDKAQADYDRTQQLAASGAVAPAELESVRRSLDLARAQRASAAAQLAGTTGADTRLASGGLLQAEAQRAGAELRVAQLRLLATSPGTVLARAVEPGDVVQPGKALLTIAVDGEMALVFQADERNLGSIALAQKAKASADAYPAVEFDAETSYIAPSIDPQRGTVEVRLKVPKPPPFLRADMTVSIDLLVATRAGALVLPSEAIRGAATPSPYVWVVEGGKLQRRPVTLGITGDGATEILSGVDLGVEVALPDAKPFEPGQQVRATRKDL